MKPLGIVRDVVVVVGMVIICWTLIERERQREHAREVHLARTKQAISALEEAYKNIVFEGDAKGIYQQMFRQAEIAMEYQKLALLRDLLPTAQVDLTAVPAVK